MSLFCMGILATEPPLGVVCEARHQAPLGPLRLLGAGLFVFCHFAKKW